MLRRLSPGDGVVYYSPKEKMEASAKVQAYVAIGHISPGEIYQAQQSDCFQPSRRDVNYFESKDAPISPLLDRLSFSSGGANWGLMMRRGLFEITETDFKLISQKMKIANAESL